MLSFSGNGRREPFIAFPGLDRDEPESAGKQGWGCNPQPNKESQIGKVFACEVEEFYGGTGFACTDPAFSGRSVPVLP